MKRGSILMMVLWIIAVLSVMVLSVAAEARLYSGVNVAVRERNRVNRLVEPAQALAEIVLCGYSEVQEWTEGEDLEELLEDDRWILEKRDLKESSKCTIGPLVIDEEDPDSGTVTIDIELVNGGEKNAININELYQGGDKNWQVRWQMILRNVVGISEDLEVEDEDGKRVKLAELLMASWNDWRDEDKDNVTQIDSGATGAEAAWYEEYYDDNKIEDEDMRYPRNAAIPDIKELQYLRGFRTYPAVLTGGLLNPKEKDDSEENPTLKAGLTDLLGVSGSAKVNANSCTVEQLMTIPGIFDEDDEEDGDGEGMERAKAIVACLKIQPKQRDDFDETRTWWPYRDWGDMTQRVLDEFDVEIGTEAQEYLTFGPDETSIFKVKIVCASMGFKREVQAEAYVKEKKVRYIKWRED